MSWSQFLGSQSAGDKSHKCSMGEWGERAKFLTWVRQNFVQEMPRQACPFDNNTARPEFPRYSPSRLERASITALLKHPLVVDSLEPNWVKNPTLLFAQDYGHLRELQLKSILFYIYIYIWHPWRWGLRLLHVSGNRQTNWQTDGRCYRVKILWQGVNNWGCNYILPGYLPRHRTLSPFGQYVIILLCDRTTHVNHYTTI